MPSRLQDYDVLGLIGSGSYGTCKKIRRIKDNKILVWKELDYGKMSETEKQMLVSEVNLLRELKHPHIVRYYDRIIDRTNTTIYIVMEYCEGGDLGALISKHKREKRYVLEEYVWKIMYQLILAVQECHRRKNGAHVLHRDLKPANVFLDAEKNVKLGDFGLARVLMHDTSFAKTFVGTPYYMSPDEMRPSIDSLLRNPHLSRMQKDTTSNINVAEKEESLKRWEKTLNEKERDIERKEKELSNREKVLADREERISRLEEECYSNGYRDHMVPVKRSNHPQYYQHFGMDKENENGLIAPIVIKRRYACDIDTAKLANDDVFARPMLPAHRLQDFGYRHPNIVGNVRVSRLLSVLR